MLNIDDMKIQYLKQRFAFVKIIVPQKKVTPRKKVQRTANICRSNAYKD
jgi:hypothetical protein